MDKYWEILLTGHMITTFCIILIKVHILSLFVNTRDTKAVNNKDSGVWVWDRPELESYTLDRAYEQHYND